MKKFILFVSMGGIFSGGIPNSFGHPYSDLLANARLIGASPFAKTSAPSRGSGDATRYFFMCAGLPMPMGSFKKAPSSSIPTYDYTASFVDNAGMGAKSGFLFELGILSKFKKIELSDPMELWVKLTAFKYQANGFSWASRGGFWASDSIQYSNDFYIISIVKVGPSLSINSSENFQTDFFYQLDPTYTSVIVQDGTGTNGPRTFKLDGDGIGIRHAIGFNIRLSRLMVGVEYNFGKIKYSFNQSYAVYDPTMNYNNGGWKLEDTILDTKTGISTLNLTIGFNLSNR